MQTSSSLKSASTGTVEATTDCPESNGTTYQPLQPNGGTGIYTFTKYCGFDTTGTTIAEAFVSSFDYCLDMCSNLNIVNQNTNCTAVTYLVQGGPPGNCWAKSPGALLVANGRAATGLLQL